MHMEKYTMQVLNAFQDDIRTLAATPASDNLFEVQHDDITKPLPEHKPGYFTVSWYNYFFF